MLLEFVGCAKNGVLGKPPTKEEEVKEQTNKKLPRTQNDKNKPNIKAPFISFPTFQTPSFFPLLASILIPSPFNTAFFHKQFIFLFLFPPFNCFIGCSNPQISSEMKEKSCTELPPGFRFHPTDEELIMFYLRNQATSKPCPVSIIPEVDIYKFDPWDLPEKADSGENEWYFFSPRDRKYPNGVRPNRAAVSGYWKATGTDKAIYSASKYVGVKKALVFYKGKPPKGIKTDWIMHEYRLIGSNKQSIKQSGSMRLDDWVLCRIYKKRHLNKALEEEKREELPAQNDVVEGNGQQMMKFPRTFSITHLLDLDYLGPISQIFNDNSSMNPTLGFQNTASQTNVGKIEQGEMPFDYSGSADLQVNPNNNFFNQAVFLNPAYDWNGLSR